MRSGVHRDLIAPVSYFEGGELWLQSPRGQTQLVPNGPKGKVCALFDGETPTPVMFSPKQLHATLPWSDDRTVLVAFHIRHSAGLPNADEALLRNMGLHLRSNS